MRRVGAVGEDPLVQDCARPRKSNQSWPNRPHDQSAGMVSQPLNQRALSDLREMLKLTSLRRNVASRSSMPVHTLWLDLQIVSYK